MVEESCPLFHKVVRIEILHGIDEKVWGLDCRIGTRIIRFYFPIKKYTTKILIIIIYNIY